MTTHELATLVGEMRTAQREYFRTKQPGALSRSKDLERRVDTTIRTLVAKAAHPDLFDAESSDGQPV